MRRRQIWMSFKDVTPLTKLGFLKFFQTMAGGRLVCIVISAVVLTVAQLQHTEHFGHDIDWSALNLTETIRKMLFR